MKLCYVDETGTDGKSPIIVMVGVVADSQRLRRTQADFLSLFTKMGELSPKTLRELKAVDLYLGNEAWRGVEGLRRHQLVSDFCDWLCDRKHHIALAAIDKKHFAGTPLADGLDAWMTAALHIGLQVQHAHQKLKRDGTAQGLVDS